MSKFFPLKVSEVKRETNDTVILSFEIPTEIANDFKYKQGQYLTFRIKIGNEELRRSYSLCSSPFEKSALKVAVKEVPGGKMSSFINKSLKVGDTIDTLPPAGNFLTELNAANSKHYVAFAAGSGITPVFSILKSVLIAEPKSRFTLVYANRNKSSIILNNDIQELVNKYADRFNLVNVFSADNSELEILKGRLDKNSIPPIVKQFNLLSGDEYFICGPEEMILSVSDFLTKEGKNKSNIHFELFTTPVNLKSSTETTNQTEDFKGESKVKVIIDGIETSFTLNAGGINILDAAMNAGADAPFSCKGAVCCTCKAKVIEGKVSMDMNYSLTDNEVANGYILTCQAHPQSSDIVIDYDVA